ncbi:hypothetical protein AMTR_s00128p00021230 [Amborella trichopoda]|uniref:Uncharacterized protein n=1 Tax=Amborella trichopoda TaxID=13333 RepID=W1NPE7_AMBTC|nr:hypothetical protein AMTR_s00128p00021230 [Amborella trichopoda]
MVRHSSLDARTSVSHTHKRSIPLNIRALSSEGDEEGTATLTTLRRGTSRMGSLMTRARDSPEGDEGSSEASSERASEAGDSKVGDAADLDEETLGEGVLSASTAKTVEAKVAGSAVYIKWSLTEGDTSALALEEGPLN